MTPHNNLFLRRSNVVVKSAFISSISHFLFSIQHEYVICIAHYTYCVFHYAVPVFMLGDGLIIIPKAFINPSLTRWSFHYVVTIISPFVHVFMRVLL